MYEVFEPVSYTHLKRCDLYQTCCKHIVRGFHVKDKMCIRDSSLSLSRQARNFYHHGQMQCRLFSASSDKRYKQLYLTPVSYTHLGVKPGAYAPGRSPEGLSAAPEGRPASLLTLLSLIHI